MRGKLSSAFILLFGRPPSSSATLLEKRRWTRQLYLRLFPAQLIATCAAVLLGAPAWLDALLAACAALWLVGFILVNFEIRNNR
jgi:hypothetical protein